MKDWGHIKCIQGPEYLYISKFPLPSLFAITASVTHIPSFLQDMQKWPGNFASQLWTIWRVVGINRITRLLNLLEGSKSHTYLTESWHSADGIANLTFCKWKSFRCEKCFCQENLDLSDFHGEIKVLGTAKFNFFWNLENFFEICAAPH